MDTSELRFGSVQNLFLELETLPLTEPFRMHLILASVLTYFIERKPENKHLATAVKSHLDFYHPPKKLRGGNVFSRRSLCPSFCLERDSLDIPLQSPVGNPGFSRGGCANSRIAKNCMKMKEFGSPGGRAPLVPPLRSANGPHPSPPNAPTPHQTWASL